jgi:hypothetical protein
MALYRANFERFNYSVTPPLKQTADVVLQTDIPFDDEHLEAFEAALWDAMWTQNPHWADSNGPKGLAKGWSSVMGGHRIELIQDGITRSFAWYIPARAWLLADGESTTEDVEQAARFSNEEILALQERYPGERYSMVMPKPVREVFDENGKSVYSGPAFELCFDDWVLWNYGNRAPGYDRVAPAQSRMVIAGRVFSRSFKLPAPLGGNAPQEYERKRAWAWRLFRDDSWKLAASPEAAEAAARTQALNYMRSSGEHNCSQWLAIRHNRKVHNYYESSEGSSASTESAS